MMHANMKATINAFASSAINTTKNKAHIFLSSKDFFVVDIFMIKMTNIYLKKKKLKIQLNI